MNPEGKNRATETPVDHEDEVMIDDLGALTDVAIVMGCGDDNPYR